MMENSYSCLSYDSYRYKSVLEQLNINESYYLSNKRDKSHYSYISWRMNYGNVSNKYKEFGEGYLVSSIILLEQCLNDNRDRKGDGVIFPILFDIEQGVELYIKALIKLLQENNLAINMKFFTHDIKTLLSKFEKEILSENGTLYHIACLDFEYVDKFVKLLFEKTNDCTYARYPYDKSNNEHFYVNTHENIIIDMKILLNWVKAIFYILDRNFIKLEDAIGKSQGEY